LSSVHEQALNFVLVSRLPPRVLEDVSQSPPAACPANDGVRGKDIESHVELRRTSVRVGAELSKQSQTQDFQFLRIDWQPCKDYITHTHICKQKSVTIFGVLEHHGTWRFPVRFSVWNHPNFCFGYGRSHFNGLLGTTAFGCPATNNTDNH
jgi:hypothetical protein